MTQTRLRPIDEHLLKELDTFSDLIKELVGWAPKYGTSLKNELHESIHCVWSRCDSRMTITDREGFPHWKCNKCGAIVNLDYPGE